MCFSVFCRALQGDLEWALGFAKSAAERGFRVFSWCFRMGFRV